MPSIPRPGSEPGRGRVCRAAPPAPTLVLLQLADLAQHGLQVHVEPVAAAEQLQEVTGAQRAARVVDEFPGRGQPVGKDLELLALRTNQGKLLKIGTGTLHPSWSTPK